MPISVLQRNNIVTAKSGDSVTIKSKSHLPNGISATVVKKRSNVKDYVLELINVDDKELAELAEYASAYAHSIGLVARTVERSFNSEPAVSIPVTLLPSAFPYELYMQAVDVQTVLNELYFRIANDHHFLMDAFKVEVTEYLRAKTIPLESDPYAYWRGENSVKWPLLSKASTKYLSAPATSAESERLFSTAGLIVNNLRKSLRPENVELLLFLHDNLKIYNFDYE